MRTVVQLVKEASCTVDSHITGQIGKGYMLLVGISEDDTLKQVEKMAQKVVKLRIFEDENHMLNKDIRQVDGSILSVSQFTLYGDAKKGNRPSFSKAMKGDKAKEYYDYFNQCLRELGMKVEEGIFGADMQIALINDGPITILLEE